jgi:hypothetical protein
MSVLALVRMFAACSEAAIFLDSSSRTSCWCDKRKAHQRKLGRVANSESD